MPEVPQCRVSPMMKGSHDHQSQIVFQSFYNFDQITKDSNPNFNKTFSKQLEFQEQQNAILQNKLLNDKNNHAVKVDLD